MKRLYLLRHAQASSSFGEEDRNRSLTETGIEQSKNLAQHVQNIDLCLCSSAKRTRMTLEGIEKTGSNIKKVEYLDSLYNAPADDLLNAISSSSTGSNVLMIAHNPGIHILANTLIGDGDKSQINHLMVSYKPATLSVINCPIDDWQEIKANSNSLIDLIIQH